MSAKTNLFKKIKIYKDFLKIKKNDVVMNTYLVHR